MASSDSMEQFCEFGYIMETPGGPCNATYASLSQDNYDLFRLACLVYGVTMLAFCLAKLRAISRVGGKYQVLRRPRGAMASSSSSSSTSATNQRTAGSGIQKVTYWLLVLASLTFVARAIDPWGYMGILSYVVVTMISDTCTACIYSVLILAVSLWARVVVTPKNLAHFEYPIQAFRILGFMFTWVIFVGIVPISVYCISNDVYHSVHTLIQFSMAPFLLWIIASMGLVFGIQIHRRLKEIRKAQEATLEVARRRVAARQALLDLTKPPVVKSESQDDTTSTLPMDLDTKEGIDAASKLPAKSSRILKMLCFLQAVSIVVIGLQVCSSIHFIVEERSWR
ncbi:hypothetical protein SPRG_10908 [Saprolegnia parasitica CBS 223.65]|uniref:THH1/TOM1/TOM3 domain-containing protein n=1 Tax=Saprolegnia parasitica (strain CBS 223.65) TaxID=695850 RepID=A0A067C4R3_SAPPC|nr:hypothetical protein SPRG_10908 [Saprolegnia parasitica CBS 223.65]KDO24120.1 hypothetical protein SPRG_10908 [Saprolegnia parasitica CBS 223.65]|eukprot:XP_012205255.1 hypothetical protein SPRG_10908 [Saprolegnia parasitica CBS 223.65]